MDRKDRIKVTALVTFLMVLSGVGTWTYENGYRWIGAALIPLALVSLMVIIETVLSNLVK